MDINEALEWAAARHNGVLITLRRDGRAQSSDIVYATDGDIIRVSVTADRAKTANMRRDNRVVLHLTDPSSWSYVSFDATAELSPECAEPDDTTADELVALYRAVSDSDHPDWADYRQAMIDDRRLVARITPHSATGQIH